MMKYELDSLAHRVRPYISFRADGKSYISAKIREADRVLLRTHWREVDMRLRPYAYHRGEPITEEQIQRALVGSGDLHAYDIGKITKIDALRMTKSWLTQVAQWDDLRWSGRRIYL